MNKFNDNASQEDIVASIKVVLEDVDIDDAIKIDMIANLGLAVLVDLATGVVVVEHTLWESIDRKHRVEYHRLQKSRIDESGTAVELEIVSSKEYIQKKD